MAKKKFVLRIDEQLLAAVEKWAADDFRSVNGQMEWMISSSLKDAGRIKPGTVVEPSPPEEEEATPSP